LNPQDTASFEIRLASDQFARDALSEVVRLSAAALGQSPPTPHPSFRAAIRERLLGWRPSWLARRSYRGHPLAWSGLGASAVVASVVIGLSFSQGEPQRTSPSGTISSSKQTGNSSESKPQTVASDTDAGNPETLAIAPMPHEHALAANCNDEHLTRPSVAEIWAELSTPDHVEKAHEEEVRWRHKLREMGTTHAGRQTQTSSINEPKEP